MYVRSQAAIGSGIPVLVSADGRSETPLTAAPLDNVEQPRLSPDGRRMAIVAGGNIWVYDLGGRPPIKLTFGDAVLSPQWTPDGKQLVFEGGTPSALRAIAADGSGALSAPLTPVGHFHPHGFTPDGRELVVVRIDGGVNPGTAIERVTLGGTPEPTPIVQTSAAEGFYGAALSPDGKWLAYVSNATGENEIWVQPYPGPGVATRVSANGGTEPVWARNGRELYYLERTVLMRVEVDTRSSFQFKAYSRLFDANSYSFARQPPSYDVGPDGRFLMIKAEQRATLAPIVVVLNWFEELKRLAPAK